MKRPQGFDTSRSAPPTPQSSAPVRAPRVAEQLKSKGASSAVAAEPVAQSVRSAKAELRQARRQRVAFERGEVRRFTKHSRNRRVLIAAIVAVVLVLVGGVTALVFSPALELKTITIVGASHSNEAEIQAAIDHQLGTPLALIDFDALTDDLSNFPRIRSYTTESVPPHTLVLTIVERQAIGVIGDGSSFSVVDPAGVVLETLSERPEELPLIAATTISLGDPAFDSIVDVLLVLPPDLLARVDLITATTKDDVTFELGGGAQSVLWGSADQSELKSRVLEEILATRDASARFEYDVSAPEAVVVRAR